MILTTPTLIASGFAATFAASVGVTTVPPAADLSPSVIQVASKDRWGVTDPAALKKLEQELLTILEGPVQSSSRGTLSDADRKVIELDPELHEAYRSAPEATLNLINRIRDAGGLKP